MEEKMTYFTKDMRKDYTIFIPPMLPIQVEMLIKVMSSFGYNMVMMKNDGEDVMRKGTKFCHNDTCYPAQVVIGEMLDVIESGKYDIHKIAFLITQTGGGCRASNYIFLMRKALQNAGYPFIPIISFNFKNDLENSGFKLVLPMLYRMLYACLVGDLVMTLAHQTRPYEIEKGNTERLIDKWIMEVGARLTKKNFVTGSKVNKMYKEIINDFKSIPLKKESRVKVGIVGEIFVKFSPYGNNHLEEFLEENGAEVVMGGLADFCLYCVNNGVTDAEFYGINRFRGKLLKLGCKMLAVRQDKSKKYMKKYSDFIPTGSFYHTKELAGDYISLGVKMGEGWLLTAEMAELIDSGVKNIVCAQPFGCLPNHIVGKGMIKPMKEKNPDVNIVSIDYDFSATKANQENRIRLMLANAEKQKKKAEL